MNVVIPRRLDGRQKQLLEELRDSLTPDTLAAPDDGMLSKLRRALRV